MNQAMDMQMTYEEFYYEIDCNFPYHDEEAWKKIISQSHAIGGDAPFLVLHEICRLPSSVKLDKTAHLKLYKYWKSSFDSPVQHIIEPACLALINEEGLSGEETLAIMEALRPYPKNYNALLVVLYACPDEQDSVESTYDDIVASWKRTDG